MNSFVLWLIAWSVCVPTTYMLIRDDFRKTSGKWTQFDRIFGVALSLVYGPFLFVVIIIVGLAWKFARTDWAKREVPW